MIICWIGITDITALKMPPRNASNRKKPVYTGLPHFENWLSWISLSETSRFPFAALLACTVCHHCSVEETRPCAINTQVEQFPIPPHHLLYCSLPPPQKPYLPPYLSLSLPATLSSVDRAVQSQSSDNSRNCHRH